MTAPLRDGYEAKPRMKTLAAPASTWEARLRWGSRRLSAELLDGRGRTSLSLGDGPEDDVAIGSAARASLDWRPEGLEAWLSSGVEAELNGRPLSELLQSNRAHEERGGFVVRLSGDDELALRIGTLIVEVRKAKGRFPRLPIDLRGFVFIALAVLAVSIVLASVMAPPELPKLYRRR